MKRTRTLHRLTLAALSAAALTLTLASAAQADPGWRRWKGDGPRYVGGPRWSGGPRHGMVYRERYRGDGGPALAGLIGGFMLGAALAGPHPVVVRERACVPAPACAPRRARFVECATPRYRYEDASGERWWDTLDECREAAFEVHGPRVIRVIDDRTDEYVRTLYWKHDHFIADDDRDDARDD